MMGWSVRPYTGMSISNNIWTVKNGGKWEDVVSVKCLGSFHYLVKPAWCPQYSNKFPYVNVD